MQEREAGWRDAGQSSAICMRDKNQEVSIYSVNKYLLNSYYVPSKKEENEQESKKTKNTGGVK